MMVFARICRGSGYAMEDQVRYGRNFCGDKYTAIPREGAIALLHICTLDPEHCGTHECSCGARWNAALDAMPYVSYAIEEEDHLKGN